MNVDVLTSSIWQTNSTILSRAGACIVVDPAYFPREVDAIAARVGELGRAEGVVFTHGHWDHIMGHSAFPDAPVSVGRTLAEAIAANHPRAARLLEDAREFDSRWYVPRPSGHRWPERLRGLADGESVELGGATLRAMHLPGHSPDDLGLLVDDLRLLLVGDYLSPCEIPFIDDADAYRATLARLLDVLAGVREVVPGARPTSHPRRRDRRRPRGHRVRRSAARGARSPRRRRGPRHRAAARCRRHRHARSPPRQLREARPPARRFASVKACLAGHGFLRRPFVFLSQALS